MTRILAAVTLLLIVCAILLHAAGAQEHAEHFGELGFLMLFLALIVPDQIAWPPIRRLAARIAAFAQRRPSP